jgi:hypothetical protein
MHTLQNTDQQDVVEHSMSVKCLMLNKFCIVIMKISLQFKKVNGCPSSHSHRSAKFPQFTQSEKNIKIKQVFAQPSRDTYQGRKKKYTCTIDYSVISGLLSFSK